MICNTRGGTTLAVHGLRLGVRCPRLGRGSYGSGCGERATNSREAGHQHGGVVLSCLFDLGGEGFVFGL
jgi:hypothetical protein